MVHPAYGGDYRSKEKKAREKANLFRYRKGQINDHGELLFSIKEDVFKEIEAYHKGELGDEGFYSRMIAEAIRLGSCQRKYERRLKDSERNKDLAEEIKGIILDGMLNGKSKSSKEREN